MANWVPNISLITDGEVVNQTTIGRVTGSLKQRTDYLYETLNNLQVQSLVYPGVPCNSSVSDYQVGYLNGSSGLVELANGGNTSKTSAIGIIINKRAAVGGFQCDLHIKGVFRLPTASLSTLITEGSWTSGAVAYLSTTDGELTFIEPALSVPMGVATIQDSANNYVFIFDGDTYLNLQHRHIREVIDWVPTTNGGTGAYTLTYEPVLPSAVFALVNSLPLLYDDDSVGTYNTAGDPDFVVSGKTLQIYKQNRFELNSYDPKLEVWYSYPYGNSAGVTGLIAGHNIQLNSCGTSGNIQSGVVTVNAVPGLKFTTDNSNTGSLKQVSIDPATKALSFTSGATVNKLTAGVNIYFTGDNPTGQGNFVINARDSVNSYELLKPESLFLENGKETFLFDRWHCYSLESQKSQEITCQFRSPDYLNSSVKPSLYLEYLVGDSVPDGVVELSISIQELKEGSTLADSAFTVLTKAITILNSEYKLKKSVIIPLPNYLSPKSSFIAIVGRTLGVSDTYAGSFSVMHTRLRITPTKI